MNAADIALSFEQLSVSLVNPLKPLLYNVSGYVAKGGITAVLGASAAGKSLLLQTLAGRIQDLNISGQVTMNGGIVNPKRLDNPVAYVPQDDSLVGELTAREVTTNAALFKLNDDRGHIDKNVSELLENLGLTKVADGIIGTLIFRGLSGGQKKRVEISSELIASPSVLLMDEPTSGLDSSIAYDVLTTVRDLVKKSNGKLSVILTIHQPNSKILGLFDHLLLLESGASFFFGTLEESHAHFSKLGYCCPENVTPTDYFLQIADTNFSDASNFDFITAFEKSEFNVKLRQVLLSSPAENVVAVEDHQKATNEEITTTFRKFYTLVYREYALAYRDPTLYYLQVVLFYGFGFVVGAIFFQLPFKVSGDFPIYSGGILWICLLFGWSNAFKVFHINRNDKRMRHEVANNKYSPVTYFLADFFSTATLQMMFIPITAMAYFMMGFPGKSYPYVILVCWTLGLVSEAMLSFICKFSTNPTVSMNFAQKALVDLMVFGCGIFIPWNQTPKYWIWLQEISLFTQSSRTALMEVMDGTTFLCTLNAANQCVDPSTAAIYSCATTPSNGECMVNGREILYVTQGIVTYDGYWQYYGYLILIGLFFKASILFFMIYPWDRVQFFFSTFFKRNTNTTEHHQKITLAYKESRKLKDASVKSNSSANTSVAFSKAPAAAVQEESKAGGEMEFSGIQKSNALVTASTVEEGRIELRSSSALTWSHLNVQLPKPKSGSGLLVDDSNGMVTCGRVLALMGPSGAGKTTLLNALAKRAKYAKVTGDVKFAGREMTTTDLTYVPQFDTVNGILTIEEHFHLVGSMTCTDIADMKRRTKDLLEVLGFTSKKDVQVKNLSGGELKRVSIGIGMISNPKVLFLDEPTTGLDSTAAYSIVRYITNIAKATKVAVIMTIHQPSALVFNMLDDLLLLETGRTIFAGSIASASDYFRSIGLSNPDHINPADYFLEFAQNPPPSTAASVVQKADGEVTFRDIFEKSQFFNDYLTTLNQSAAMTPQQHVSTQPLMFTRFCYLLMYFMKYFIKEPGFFVYRLYSLILSGVFTGTLFLRLTPETQYIQMYSGSLFYITLSVMMTVVASTSLFAKDRYEAVDRVRNGIYSPGVYVSAQFLSSSFYNLVCALVVMSLYQWLTNVNPSIECFIYDWLLTWGHLLLMESALQVFLELLKNDFLSTSCCMVFVGFNMVASGFFRPIAQIPVWISWICYIPPLRWSFSGFITMVFKGQDFYVTGSNPAVYVTGTEILSQAFNLSNVNTWGMFAVLMAYVLVFRAAHYFLFSYQTK